MQSESKQNGKLEAALRYASMGYPVIPVWFVVRKKDKVVCGCGNPSCPSPGKHPLGRLVPNGLKAATNEESVIRRRWSHEPHANIGLVMGQASGLIALDVDGDKGRESLKGKHLPPGPVSITGRGEHRLYRWPGFRVPPKAGLLPGVDVRGDDSYIIAPPSSHYSGRHYRWEDFLSLGEVDIPACPEWLAELLKALPQGVRDQPQTVGDQEAEIIPKGERNDRLTSIAGSMRRRGLTRKEIEAALLEINKHRCVPPLPEEEVRQIAKSVVGYKPSHGDPDSSQGDYGHAKVLSGQFRGRFRWATHRGRWMEYREGVWCPVADEYVELEASRTARSHYVVELASEMKEEEIKRLNRAIADTCSHSRMLGALEFLKGWEGILTKAEEWDKEPYLLSPCFDHLLLYT